MPESCDVVVIGGGPGGSACATLLADRGFAVTLLERSRFPREHVGESLLPASIPVLEQLGVMPQIEAAGFVTKRGATLVWGKDPEPWSWYFADDPQQRPTSFQVVRSQFDQILLENARAHGVDVRENHQVLGVDFEGDRATGVRVLHDRVEGRIGARFVVDASGRRASAKCASTAASRASVLASRPVARAKSRTWRGLTTTTGSAAAAQPAPL